MIINSLHAKNFRKYHKLEIDNIPESGIITIAGPNESGKTSIGEAICFALFGRTFSLDKNNLHKAICWGQDLTEVTLNFSTKSGESYTLRRSYDREGKQTASLRKDLIVEKKDSTQINLNTTDKVSKALTKILGFTYESFSNSLYLVQRELTTPDPNSDTIKQMAGIADYTNITKMLEKTIQERQEKIAELMPDVKIMSNNLDAIGIDDSWLPDLVDAETTLGEEQKRREALMRHLDESGTGYADNIKRFHSTRRSRGLWSFLAVLAFPIAIVSWLFWTLFKNRPTIYNDVISNSIGSEKLPRMLDIANNYLLPVAIVSTLIFFLSILLKQKSTKNLFLLHKNAVEMSESMREGYYFITTQVETLLPERVVQLFNKRKKDQSTLLITPPREQFTNLPKLIEGMPNYKANGEEVSNTINSLSSSLKSQDIEIIDLERSLIDDIEQERLRSDDAGKLRSTLKVLNRTVKGHKYDTDVEIISTALLQRAAADSIDQFNRNIAKTSAKALPKFTDNRYNQIRIAENLNVQVYSDNKKDYMDFDEISSGTQRQIMLALRIAMSEELSKNSDNDQQFIFLDEPFAFFDQARMLATLRTLPEVSKVISQIWVVAQEFSTDITVAKAILCTEDSAELVV